MWRHDVITFESLETVAMQGCFIVILFFSGLSSPMLNYTSSTENSTFSVTTWEYPWPPQIHWLDEYLNLSSFLPIHIEGLILGDKLKLRILNESHPNFGWMVSWKLNADIDYWMHTITNIMPIVLKLWWSVNLMSRESTATNHWMDFQELFSYYAITIHQDI